MYFPFKQEVVCWKTSSLQGIVRAPMGWSYPNSSSAWLNKSWKEGWFKYDIGITNRFCSSPTYTARYPFGTCTDFEAACLELDDACRIPSKRKPIFELLMRRKKNNQDLEGMDRKIDAWEWDKDSVYIVLRTS